MGDAGTCHIEAEAHAGAKPELSDLVDFPVSGYSLTLVGVLGGQTVRSERPTWRGRSLEQLIPLGAIAAGLGFASVAVVIYIAVGYSKGMLWLWLVGLAIAVAGFAVRSRALPRIAWAEPLYALGAVALCAPLYLVALYRWPDQVGSDEIAIMTTSKHFTEAHVDPFSTSYYLSRPTLLFAVWGRLGNLIGGVDLFHMRLLHGMVGLLTLVACYVLFRQLLPRNWAFLATILVGVNHALFMISRMAMRENTALLVVVVSLALLLWGLRNDHELAFFLGGIVSGLGFYVYEPGRVAFPIWIAFLVGLRLLYSRQFATRRLLTAGAITTAGFVLMAAPLIYSESQIPAGETRGQAESLMLYNKARVIQQHWVFADSQFAGWVENVKHGLGTFNSNTVDHSWTYPNYGHGFLDPLTGIALWVGVAVVGLAIVRRRRDDEGALLMLGGFLVLWLSFAFLVNKAPNYTRLLITLPFVSYLAVQALRWATNRWRSIEHAPELIVGAFVVAVVALNLSAAWDFVQVGRAAGEPIGDTGRYVHAHQNVPGQRFYLVTSDASPYYVWGSVSTSIDRLRIFAKPTVVQQPVDPLGLQQFTGAPPFALFMRREVWMPSAAALAERYPRGRIRNVTKDGSRVVFEVPS
jgi:hypothetical protein